MEKYSPYKGNSLIKKQPFVFDNKGKRKEKMAKVTKKKNFCHNWRSTDSYAKSFPKAKQKIYAIEKVQEDEILAEDSESDSIGDSIRVTSDDDQDPIEEFLVEHLEEPQLE
ncbi:hypothetical protein O181_092289 [Austropuccinia psidii MF-1]|uniref:Uncharacterized protein n=1 Tax=Austropuccinia psidii MF-1 TaxID=1389203 RepID=A0A9Q3P8Q5_9BASI|nr:hypothetical protein [Austropuccinia psidii MF-1]